MNFRLAVAPKEACSVREVPPISAICDTPDNFQLLSTLGNYPSRQRDRTGGVICPND